MSNRISDQGSSGNCSFCGRQMNRDVGLGSGERGGIYTPAGSSPSVRLCTYCVATDVVAALFAGAVQDSSLDPAAAAAGLAAAVNAALGL